MTPIYAPIGDDEDKEVEIMEWLCNLPHHSYRWVEEYSELHFANEADAIAFKLKFGGV